jgi:hypothetical protein
MSPRRDKRLAESATTPDGDGREQEQRDLDFKNQVGAAY